MRSATNEPGICLTMIVKNEAHVIERCLASVRPLLSHWIVVDTGSTDGTQEKVRAFLRDLPGELVERPWRDFAHNRTEAIELARGRAAYDLVIDADDVLEIPEGFRLPELDKDSYEIRVEDCGTVYYRVHLFRGDLDFRYAGVLHEVIGSPTPRTLGRLDGLVYRRSYDGARSGDPKKFEKDAAVLEKALTEEPDNARYVFYLAQSWRDAGQLEKAAEVYAHRASMGGWGEEVYFSRLERAKLLERLQRTDEEIIAAYLAAYEARPTRAESLCELARFLRTRNRLVLAYPFAQAASAIPRPSDILFVDESVYAWRALDEVGISAYYAGRFAEGAAANERLLAENKLPDAERPRVEKNLRFCSDELAVRSKSKAEP